MTKEDISDKLQQSNASIVKTWMARSERMLSRIVEFTSLSEITFWLGRGSCKWIYAGRIGLVKWVTPVKPWTYRSSRKLEWLLWMTDACSLLSDSNGVSISKLSYYWVSAEYIIMAASNGWLLACVCAQVTKSLPHNDESSVIVGRANLYSLSSPSLTAVFSPDYHHIERKTAWN